jgi:hypothetical protein
MIATLFIFSVTGCTSSKKCTPDTKIIMTKVPKLKNFDYNDTLPFQDIKIKKVGDNIEIKSDEWVKFVIFSQKLKFRAKNLSDVLKLYKEQNDRFNKEFAK